MNHQIHLTFRDAAESDADFLLRLRNDPETRAASVNQAEVHVDQHLAWLKKALNSKSLRLCIVARGGEPIGTVRLDKRPKTDRWELSWTMAPECRGKGLGKEMVRQAAAFFAVPLFARIKPDNDASKRIARHAGLSPVKIEDGCEIWHGRTAEP